MYQQTSIPFTAKRPIDIRFLNVIAQDRIGTDPLQDTTIPLSEPGIAYDRRAPEFARPLGRETPTFMIAPGFEPYRGEDYPEAFG